MSALQDSLHGTDYGVALLSQEDTALHHTRSPRCSGSLLRGSLAITTTGLPPVSHQNLSRRTMLLLDGSLRFGSFFMLFDHAVGTYERYSCSASPRTLSYERYAQISAAAARERMRAARANASTLCDPCWLAATGDHVLACERRSHSLKSMLPRRASPNGTSDRSSTRPPKYRASGSLTTVRGSPIAFR
jgi:hypothetical protein